MQHQRNQDHEDSNWWRPNNHLKKTRLKKRMKYWRVQEFSLCLVKTLAIKSRKLRTRKIEFQPLVDLWSMAYQLMTYYFVRSNAKIDFSYPLVKDLAIEDRSHKVKSWSVSVWQMFGHWFSYERIFDETLEIDCGVWNLTIDWWSSRRWFGRCSIEGSTQPKLMWKVLNDCSPGVPSTVRFWQLTYKSFKTTVEKNKKGRLKSQ